MKPSEAGLPIPIYGDIDIEAEAARSRAACGKPLHVEDPEVIRVLVDMFFPPHRRTQPSRKVAG